MSGIILIADKLRTNILIVFISAILIKTEGSERNREGNHLVPDNTERYKGTEGQSCNVSKETKN